MIEHDEDRLESIELHQSLSTERTLIAFGEVLYSALVNAERLDEVEVLMDVISEFNTMTSYYGDSTKRLPESLGVDLVEAALFKRSKLTSEKRKDSNEWKYYAEDFRARLKEAADILNIKTNL